MILAVVAGEVVFVPTRLIWAGIVVAIVVYLLATTLVSQAKT